MKINKRYELAKKKLPIYWNKLVHNENINVVWTKDGKDYLLFVFPLGSYRNSISLL